MKMVKKILFGSLVLAAALTFASCGETQDEGDSFDGDKIDFVHDGTSGLYYRSFKSTSTKHYSANATITIEDADNVTSATKPNGTAIESKAGLGFVFGLEEIKDAPVVYKIKKDKKTGEIKYNSDGTYKTEKVKFYNFGVASVRWNHTINSAQWYVSWCTNVPDSVFNYNDSSSFYDGTLAALPENTGVTIPGSAADNEICIVDDGAGGWNTISGISLKEDGSLGALIKTVANENGSYTVQLMDKDAPDTVIATGTVPAAETGLSEKTQKLIGRYLTVYKSQTIKGKIEYSDVHGNVIPADYDIIYE